jgi:hypothetical protein
VQPPVPNFDLELGVPFARRVVYLPDLRGDCPSVLEMREKGNGRTGVAPLPKA